MHFWRALLQFGLLASSALSVDAASTWTVRDATVSVHAKGAGVGGGLKKQYGSYPRFSNWHALIYHNAYRIVDNKPLGDPLTLGSSDTLKVELVTQESRSQKRPHQAFLLLKDKTTGLDTAYPFNVRDNGKARIELVCYCV